MSDHIHLEPIGQILADESQGLYQLQVMRAYRPALQGLARCTHAIVLWWADRADTSTDRNGPLVVDLPYAPGVQSGLFANRTVRRPNPIGLTTCMLIGVSEERGTVDLAWIDALDGTPLLDIKPYLPMSDRVMDAEYPDWLAGMPASMEEASTFFADPENAAKFA